MRLCLSICVTIVTWLCNLHVHIINVLYKHYGQFKERHCLNTAVLSKSVFTIYNCDVWSLLYSDEIGVSCRGLVPEPTKGAAIFLKLSIT